MTVGMIWAEDRNRAIGSGTGMLWHVPADFAHFKALTRGHPVVVGRSTWASMNSEPLPERRNIVVTRDPDYVAPGAEVVHSIAEGLRLGRESLGGEMVWIIGGTQIFEAAMDLADLLVVSILDLDASSSAEYVVYAPEIDLARFALDRAASDQDWREVSGDARWRVEIWRKVQAA